MQELDHRTEKIVDKTANCKNVLSTLTRDRIRAKPLPRVAAASHIKRFGLISTIGRRLSAAKQIAAIVGFESRACSNQTFEMGQQCTIE